MVNKIRLLVLLLVLTGSLSFPGKALATVGEACCPKGPVPNWMWDPAKQDTCFYMAGNQKVERKVLCNLSTEKCTIGHALLGTCVSKDAGVPTPFGVTCGNGGQDCCPNPTTPGARKSCLPSSDTGGVSYVPSDPFDPNCKCIRPTPDPGSLTSLDPTCAKIGKPGSINTALGCIPTSSLNEFIQWILERVIFIASGIAFLLMAFGAFQIIISGGNPDGVKAGKELITSALSGLIFIILSIFLLKLIGVDILHLPEFGA